MRSYDDYYNFEIYADYRQLPHKEKDVVKKTPVRKKPPVKPVEAKTLAVRVDPFEAIEQRILTDNPEPICLERIIRDRKGQPLEDFLHKFFDVWNENRNTVYAESKKIQTPLGRRRSLGDLFMICRYYYPELKLRELLDHLYNKLPSSMEEGFRSSYCRETSKRMWYFDPDSSTNFYDGSSNDEYGNTAEFYRSELANG